MRHSLSHSVNKAMSMHMSKTCFERVYNKLKPFLSLERSDFSNPRPQRCVCVNGEQFAVRWNPKGETRPTEEQFIQAYNLQIT